MCGPSFFFFCFRRRPSAVAVDTGHGSGVSHGDLHQASTKASCRPIMSRLGGSKRRCPCRTNVPLLAKSSHRATWLGAGRACSAGCDRGSGCFRRSDIGGSSELRTERQTCSFLVLHALSKSRRRVLNPFFLLFFFARAVESPIVSVAALPYCWRACHLYCRPMHFRSQTEEYLLASPGLRTLEPALQSGTSALNATI